MENTRYDQDEEGAHDGINHRIAQGLSENDTPHGRIAHMEGDNIAVAVPLTGRSCRQANAQHERLLDNQDEYGRQDGCTVAALGIKHRHFLDIQGAGGDQVFTNGIIARQFLLYLCPHLLGYSHRRLIDGLIGEHQGHVAIDADGALFQAVQTGGKVFRDEIDALDHLPTNKRPGIVEVDGIIGHMDIWRGIAHTDELARLVGVGQVNNRHWHLVHYLIIIDPRIEHRIQQWHDETEEQHALVTYHLTHLKTPHVGSILKPSVYLTEYKHR